MDNSFGVKLIELPSKVFKFARTYAGDFHFLFLGCIASFFLGYLGSWAPPASFVFVCLATSWVTITRHAKYRKGIILKSRQLIAENEMKEVERRLQELPSWVHFPDEEKAEWLNSIFKKFWPFINRYVQDFLRNSVENQVKEQLPGILGKGFKFGSITLGRNSPRVSGLKCFEVDRLTHTGSAAKEIIIDLDLAYPGDCNIQIVLNRVPAAGIQDLKMSGKLRIVMAPLLAKPPFVGAMTFFFKQPPTLKFNLTNAANILDLPVLNETLRNLVRDQVDSRLTLPNRMVFPICSEPEVDVVQLKYPMPEGVLRIGLIEATELVSSDFMGKSDPYAVIQVGAAKFKSKTISSNLNPVWNEFYECQVAFVENQNIEINLFDSDLGSSDETLGTTVISIKQFTQAKNGLMDQWYSLNEVSQGKIRFMVSWLNLSDNADDLRNAFKAQSLMPPGAGNLSAAYLKLVILSADNLPNNKETTSETIDDKPSALVKVSMVGKEPKKHEKLLVTPFVADSCSPTWNYGFDFFLPNPKVDRIQFQVLDEEKSRKMIGSVDLQVVDVMRKHKMQGAMDLTLQTASKHLRKPATLKIQVVLRLMVANEPTPLPTSRSARVSTTGSSDMSAATTPNDRCSKTDELKDDEVNPAVLPRVESLSRRNHQDYLSPSSYRVHSNFNQATVSGDKVSTKIQEFNSMGDNSGRKNVQDRNATNGAVSLGSKVWSLERRTATLENTYSAVETKIQSSGSLKRFQSETSVSRNNSHFEDNEKTPLIHIGFHFSQLKNRLVIEVVEAKHLSLLLHHKMNTYVTLRLAAAASGLKEQSHTTEVARTENPIWYRSFEFNVTKEILRSSVLIATLLNHIDQLPFGYCKIHLSKLSLNNDYYWFPVKPTSHTVLPVRKFRASEV